MVQAQVIERPQIVATLTSMADLERLELGYLDQVDWLEVRADLLGDVDVDSLRARFAGKLLFTLRSRAEGGQSTLSAAERYAAIEVAVQSYDYIDVELIADQASGAIALVPEAQRVLSWHGQYSEPIELAELRGLLEQQRALGAAYKKLIVAAETPEEALPSLQLQVSEGQAGDLVSFAMGESAAWSRVIAAVRGCALVYAACADYKAAAGQLSVAQLVDDYHLGARLAPSRPNRLCGLLGSPVAHSLSPRLHNGAYRDHDVDALFVPIATTDVQSTLDMLVSPAFAELRFKINGFAVTTPHKDSALAIAEATPRATDIGAANTLILKSRQQTTRWLADSTDPEGVVGPLQYREWPIAGLPAAVVGAGGAGRAAVLGLREAGAQLTLVNRTVLSGAEAAERLGVEFLPLSEFDAAAFPIVVNATALGHSEKDPLPFDVGRLPSDAVVVDMVYLGGAGRGERPTETRLIQAAKARGLRVVDGREVLLFQAQEQFSLMTGIEFDVERAAERLGRRSQWWSSIMRIQSGLPVGVNAAFFDEARATRALEALLSDRLIEGGFHEVLLPILDYYQPYEHLLAKGASESSASEQLYRFIDRDGQLLALRHDFTPMLARLVAPRISQWELPVKLFYRGDVVRFQEPRPGRQRESAQLGAEILDAPSASNEEEVLELFVDLLLRATKGSSTSGRDGNQLQIVSWPCQRA